MKFCKQYLTEKNYKLLQEMDDELKTAFLAAIAKAIHRMRFSENLDRERVKEIVNETFVVVLEIVETFNKAIDAAHLKIEKLKRLRNAAVFRGFELGAEKLQEIKAKVKGVA